VLSGGRIVGEGRPGAITAEEVGYLMTGATGRG